MKYRLLVILAAQLFATTLVNAVNLDARGIGQVLVYPYYTANGNNGTLLAVVNSTGHGKALKVRFHEGYDGRGVLDFNIYLSPHATWTGEVANRLGGADAPASIVTRDTSCTVPAFAALLGDASTLYLDFSNASYAGTVTVAGPTGNADGGPLGLDRTREGHFDVIEMGEITDGSHGSLSAITQTDGQPANCTQIVNAWNAGGYWAQDPSIDMSPPTGGLYGSESVIDVEQGLYYPAEPEAIDGFSKSVQHSAPGTPTPDLDTASVDFDGTVTAFVPYQGEMLALAYRKPIDAISALFMSGALFNEINTEPSMGAMSDWVVTSPTKRYYVDPAYIGNSIGAPAMAPFEHGFLAGYAGAQGRESSYPYACVQVDPWSYDRSGTGNQDFIYTPGGPQVGISGVADPALTPCLETSVLTFSVQNVSDPSGNNILLPLSALGSNLTNGADPYFQEFNGAGFSGSYPPAQGSLSLDLIHDINGNLLAQHRLAPATNGQVLLGLPVFGFLAVNFVNGNVTPGVLSNYSGVNKHRATVACSTTGDPSDACP
jgi:hypothetical protein